MHIVLEAQIYKDADMSANLPVAYGSNPAAAANSLGFVLADRCSSLAFEVSFTGTPTGTFKVEVSNSFDPAKDKAGLAAGTWIDITATIAPIAAGNPAGAAGGFAFQLNPFGYKYCKISYTRTSGSGTCQVFVVGKGE